jgi:hypothetical protein
MKTNLEKIRECLTLVGRIAARGALSSDKQQVVDTLMELAYVIGKPWRDCLLANSMLKSQKTQDLDLLLDELAEIDSTAPGPTPNDKKFAAKSMWN